MNRTETRPSRVGETLAEKYRITRYLGRGGMGAVYEAQHTLVGRRFAVKYLHSELAHEKEALERFRREARAAGALENENIVSIVDFGFAPDDIPYIVMELLVGEDLSSLLLRDGPLPVVRAVNIAIQACRGLDAAHAAGIVHRDLKPENLFICRRGDGTDLVKLLDFGVAKLAPAPGPMTSVTRSGAAIGTPFYMPPEQARGAKDVDHRADIYALGVILFEALTGSKPHPGHSYNEILYHILTQPVLPLASLRPGLPADLVDTIHAALALHPQDRPRSAVAFAQALARHAGRQVTPIRSQFELRVSRETAPSPVVADGPPLATRPTHPKRRLLLPALGLGLAAVATWLLLRQHAAPRHVPDTQSPRSSAMDAAPPPSPVVAGPDLRPAEGRADVVPSLHGPAATRAARPTPPVSGSTRARGPRKAVRPAPRDDSPSEPASPMFDERNPYQ